MKNIFFLLTVFLSLEALAQHEYKVVNTFHIASAGGWDYIALNGRSLYVSHSMQVNILDANNGDSTGVIPNTGGVHGIAFDEALGRGYTSNGRTNNVTVFDLKTLAVVAQVATGENPDAILFEPHTGTIITCNGRSKNLSVIDPATNTVVATIDAGGRPETAVSDGTGKLFVNIEDKNEIAEVDLKTHTVTHRWPLGGEGPTGLAYDKKSKRLFAGCDKLLIVLNAVTGDVVAKLPIGDGCDGVAFDERHKIIFTSNGEGTVTAIKESAPDKFSVMGNYATKRGARTLTIDQENGRLFLPTADLEPAVAGSRPKMIPGTFQVLVVK
jgi:YVTN family beta-propeller protein